MPAGPRIGIGPAPSSLATADFNGDGKADLAVASEPNGGVDVFLGNGDGTFQSAMNHPTGSSTSFLVVGDFNGDRKVDFAVSNAIACSDPNVDPPCSGVSVFLGNGDGSFQGATDYLAEALDMTGGDFNGDGKADLAIVSFYGAPVNVLLGSDDGSSAFMLADQTPGNVYGSAVASGDFDGDGNADLAVSVWSSVGGGTNVRVVPGNGDGTFEPAVSYAAPTTSSFGSSMISVDYDRDGIPDIILDANSALESDGNGAFEWRTVDAFPHMIVGDFNRDGATDLAGAAGDLIVRLGNGDGTFQPATNYPTGAGAAPSVITSADFNADGRADIAVAGTVGPDGGKNEIAVFLACPR